MSARLLVPAILGALLLSAPAMAGSTYGNSAQKGIQKAAAMTPAQKCKALEKQFDKAIKRHAKAAKAADAKAMRTEGGKLCASGKQADGIAKLEGALKDLGVKPRA